jgi:hypothetical protein
MYTGYNLVIILTVLCIFWISVMAANMPNCLRIPILTSVKGRAKMGGKIREQS